MMQMKKMTLYCSLILITIVSFSQGIIINEFLAINNSIIADEFGEFDDWIEIHNNSTESININGYYITDNLNDTFKYLLTDTGDIFIIDADKYLILWADGTPEQGVNHLNFKISGSGEEIGLYSLTNELIDSIEFIKQEVNISYGRDISTPEKWVLFNSPTPGNANSSNSFSGILKPPEYNIKGGLYSSGFSVKLNNPNNNGNIYYSLDNSHPDSNSTVYNTPINIYSDKVLRSVAHQEGYLSSMVNSQLYLFNKSYTLPVIAMISDSLNFWGDSGIYSNPNKSGSSWERFCQIQYFVDGKLEMESNAGMRIQGGNSVGMAKKSFRLFFKNEYGNSQLEYPLFDSNNVSSFKNLIIKSGYDDDITTSKGNLLRDAYSAELWKMIGGVFTNSNWAMLFLNNKFWGLYNLRESINEHFINSHTGLEDFDLIRYGRDGPLLKYGTLNNWNHLVSLTDTLDFTKNSTLEKISGQIDMNYFINLIAFIQCAQYRSWAWGVSAFRENSENGRWRWTIWDTDKAYTDTNWNGFSDTQSLESDKWGNFLLKKLMQNNTFNEKLITRICDLLNTTFLPENAIAVYDSLYYIIKPEMPKEIERWNPDNTYWETNVQGVRTFLNHRPDVLRNQMIEWFSLTEIHTLMVKTEGEGYLKLNTLEIKDTLWQGNYYSDVPVNITAISKPGYIFKCWNDDNNNSSIHLSVNLLKDSIIKAVFIADTQTIIDYKEVIVSEICYQSGPYNYTEDWIEIYNPNPDSVDLSGWIIKDMNDNNSYVIPSNCFIKPNDYFIIAKNFEVFQFKYPYLKNVIGSFGNGDFGFGLSAKEDQVLIYNPNKELVDSVYYENTHPWPQIADNPGGSIQLTNLLSDNSDPANWKYSIQNVFTPGAENKFDTIPSLILSKPYTISQNNINEFVSQNYPNPFTDLTKIKIVVPSAKSIELKIYNSNMQIINTLTTSFNFEGIYEITWDGTNYAGNKMPPGIYFYCIKIEENFTVRKMILAY